MWRKLRGIVIRVSGPDGAEGMLWFSSVARREDGSIGHARWFTRMAGSNVQRAM